MMNRHIVAGASDLKVHFKLGSGRKAAYVKAVDDVSLHVYEQEVLGLVGESGSGKSTFGRALLRLNEPLSGHIYFGKQDITRHTGKELRPLRKQMQMVFQDPNSSLNPRMRIKDIISEPLRVNQIGTRQERLERVAEMLERVQLPSDFMDRFPSQLSGGQKQRISIARALITNPTFLVADEAVSALDVSVQAQILNLLSDLREDLGLTILMISHDLSVVQYFSDRIAVMYLGKLMELGTVEQVFERPAHPYTKALLEAVPKPVPDRTHLAKLIEGDIPSPIDPPSGCVFQTRCPFAVSECAQVVPELTAVAPGHEAACLFAGKGD